MELSQYRSKVAKIRYTYKEKRVCNYRFYRLNWYFDLYDCSLASSRWKLDEMKR